jgi:uncharacterized LabA/DUF88 family protein
MAYRTSIFIDFWNFSLQWRNRANGDRIDWRKVPSALLAESERLLKQSGFADALHLEEALVYASYDEDDAGRKLKGWFDAFLDKQPRFRVTTRVRRSKPRSVYCRACEQSIERCPHCEEPLRWSTEKGVDTAIVTSLLSLAGEGAFDAAILLSSDTDYLPAVEWLQGRGFKVINATWANHGHELARACWASFELDAIVSELRQESAAERGGRKARAERLDETEAELVEELVEDPCTPALAGGGATGAPQTSDGGARLQRATT